MIHIAILILTLGGFAALCAANVRHQHDLFGARLFGPMSKQVRRAGWVAIILSGAVAIAALGGYGVVEWAGMLTLGAAASVLYLSRACERRKQSR